MRRHDYGGYTVLQESRCGSAFVPDAFAQAHTDDGGTHVERFN
jgi:hypothetical protein